MANNRIQFNVGYTVDKTGLNELKNSLQQIQKMTANDLMNLNKNMNLIEARNQLNQIKKSASEVSNALSKAFNSDLGSLNINKFNNELKSLDINKIYRDFSMAGSTGESAFRNIASQVLTTNLQLKQTHSLLNEMATTMGNTIKWGVASSIMNRMTGAIQEAYGYTKNLDRSLNDIRIVTNKSAEDMAEFAVQANNAAKSLAASTTDYTNASLIYYQQGLSDEETQARTETTLKTANVTRQSAAEVSELLTAVWNGYKVSAEEAELYVDKLAAVAATTAADLAELSTGMSRVASAANMMGVDVDQLNAQLATIVSVTRQAPESVGTALRSIYARMGQLKTDGEDEFGVTLGSYTEQMKQMGIEVLDEQKNMREMGDVIEDVAEKWGDWTQAQRVAAAQAMAGTRQYNNLVALFDNWDMYTEALETSSNAMGTLQDQQDIYMESTQAHIQQMESAFEGLYDSIINTEELNNVYDKIGDIASALEIFVDSIGGGGNALLGLGSIAMTVFSKQIASGINTTITNFQNAKYNAEQLASEIEALGRLRDSEAMKDEGIKTIVNSKDKMQQSYSLLSPEQISQGNILVQQLSQVKDLELQWKANEQAAVEYANKLMTAYQEGIKIKKVTDLDFTQATETTEKLQIALQGAAEDAERLQSTVKNYNDARNQYDPSLEDNDEINVLNRFLELRDAAEELRLRTDLSKGSIESLNEALGSLNEDDILEYIASGFDKTSTNATKVEQVIIRLKQAINGATTEIKTNVQNTSNVMQDEFGQAQSKSKQLGDQVKKATDAVKKFNEDAQQLGKINSFVTLASAVGQVSFAFNTLLNLWDIWNNEDLSTNEKLIRTFTIIGTLLPTLISAVQSFRKGIVGLAFSFEVVKGSATTASGAIKALWTAMGPIGWTITGVTALAAAFAAVSSAIEKNRQHSIENAEAIRDEAIAIEEENKQIQSLYENYSSLYNVYSQTGNNKDELRTATEELCDALGIEIDTLDLLSDSYDNVNKKIAAARQNQAEEALDKAQKGLQGAQTALMLGSTSSSAGSNRIDFDAGIAGYDERQVSNFLENRLKSANINANIKPSGVRSSPDFAITNIDNFEDFIAIYETIQQAYEDMATEFKDNPAILNESEIYVNVGEWLKNSKEDYENYIKLQEDVVTYVKEFADATAQLQAGNINISDISSLNDFEVYRKQYIQALENTFKEKGLEYTKDELEQYANEYLSTLDSISEYVDQFNVKEELSERLSGSQKEIQDFIKELEQSGKLDLVASLTIDENASVEEVRKQLELAEAQAQTSLTSGITTALSQAIESLQSNNDLSKLDEENQKIFQEYLQSADGIRGLITAQEEWNAVSEAGSLAQIEYLEDLREAQFGVFTENTENLKTELELNKTYLENKKERLDNQREEIDILAEQVDQYQKLQEAENFSENSKEAKALFESAEEAETAAEQIAEYKEQVDATDEALKNVNDTLENTDWAFELDMSQVEDILSIGDNILSEADKIKEAAELIGKGFIVAAEDAQTLADVYPELYENAQVLADGQVQLSAETVNSLLGDQQTILNGDTNTTIAKIDNQIAVLESAKTAAEAQLQLMKSVAEGDLSITQEELNAIANGRQDLTNYLIELGVDENEANAAIAEAMAGNYDELSRIVAEHSQDIDENLSKAVSNAANNTYNNASAMISSWNSVANAATNAWQAAQGKGNTGNIGNQGSGGSINGGYSYTSNQGSFNITNPNLSKDQKDFLSDSISNVQLDISKYSSAIADLQALKARLLANQKNTTDALNGARKGTGGKVNKGSKSGKSNKKEEESKYIDELEDEYDIYHDIDLEIQTIENDLNRLESQEKKLFGKDLIQNLNEQLDILKKQKDAYQEKIELAKMEASALKSVLAVQGVTFSNDGYISNYYSALQAKLNYTNNIIAKYNKMSAEEQEAFKDTVDKAKEDYEKFKKQIESYDKLISDTIPGLEDQIQDAVDKQIELQIKKFTMEVEIRLDMAEAEKDFNDFKRKVIDKIKDEDILGNATANLKDLLSYFNTNKTGTGPIQSLTEQINKTIQQIKQINSSKEGTVYGDNKAQALEDLQKYYKELMSQLEDVQDLVDEIKESYLDMIDEAIDAFEEQVDQYEYINDLLSHDMDVIGLLYGDDAYAEISKYYQQIEANNNKELDFLKKRVQYAYDMMQAESDPEAREKWKEEWEDALSDLNNKVEESLENIIDKYSNSINEIFSKLNDKVSNGLGLDYVNEEWDLINKNADEYLDTINGMFAIQELENKYLEALDAEDSIAGQQKLNNLMNAQLTMLREKDKLTKYDVDRANLLFEIALKEIALQNAQQNKSKMRLRRDSQGNYSYQFVSDEESIAEAQRELAQAQNDLYNFDKDKYRENLNDIYDIYSEFQEKLLELYQDQTLSAEERERQEALLVEQYGQLINGLVEQNNDIRSNLYESAFQDLANLYDVDVKNFTDMTAEEQDLLMNSLIPQWDSGIQHMTDVFAREGGFIPTCSEAFDALKNATLDYQASLDELQNIVDINFNTIADGYDKNIQKVQELMESNDDLINKYMEQIDAIQQIISEMDTLISRYQQAKSAAEAATKAAYNLWQQEQNKAATSAKKDGSSNKKTTSSSSKTSSPSSSKKTTSSNTTKKSGGDGVPRVGDVVTYTGGLYYYDEYGTAPSGSRGPGKKVTITKINNNAPYPIHVKSTDSAYGWLKKSQITGYDTGGYTGEWGGGGRLALLHQKELVLNKTDTQNLLSAVEGIRDVNSLVNGLNQSMNNRLAGMMFAFSGIGNIGNKNRDILEQQVHIEATFPNANNAKEIEAALHNLVNVAGQHAFNNRR